MIVRSKLAVPLLFFSVFVIIIGVLLAGAYYYKSTLTGTTVITDTQSDRVEITEPTIIRDSVRLRLVPTDSKQTTYKIIIDSMTQPLTGLAFQLMLSPSGANLVSNTVALDATLKNSGWQTAINSSSSIDSAQELSFSMLSSAPGSNELIDSVEIGTITFDSTPSESGVSLNSEESILTYTDNTVAPLTLLLETEP